MGFTFILGLFLCFIAVYSDAAQCEIGWTPYKDELCIKSFSNLLAYDEAKNFCSSQSSEVSTSSLVMVKEQNIEDFLEEYTDDIFEYMWLGGKYDEDASVFKWLDGEPLEFTNWAEGYPRIADAANACIEFRPPNARRVAKSDGKWADVNCQKRNRVMCQRTSTWDFEDVIVELKRIRKQHNDDVEVVTRQLEEAVVERNELRQDLQTLASRVVPIGSTYIEYSNQPSPQILWPTLTWQDISNTYAGLFFRVSGGGASGWGSTQDECAPRLTRVEYRQEGYEFPHPVDLPANGWSGYGKGGHHSTGGNIGEGLRYHTAGCEVRPRNQAVRVWKRTA